MPGVDKCLWENAMWNNGHDAYNNGHDAYLESRVLSADPIELVNLLYQACIESVRNARSHLAEKRIMERSRAINRACEITFELSAALDHERGGEISQRLAALYDYMRRQLIEANLKQADAPLAEVLGLLTTLGEAWEAIRPVERVAEPAMETQSTWSQSAIPEAAGYGAHAWSF
jgi:flagellar protein FliS